ncbi:PEP-CTERM sorting domain-containing protein [Nitrosomonas sp.]|uniref:PEP-CTERM sorting domain-containing protein n=1 Tax=Nitrosomonas sp. TaxID=42353 RepID=UPI0025DF2C98|nr:PEP-CTERM sorting domain-containing protein [Nitrosomonas sp.]
MTAIYNKMFGVLVLSVTIPATVMAASAPLIDNQVIVDNSPFYSQGAEDRLGTGNYALNHPGFIDIPYAIFDLGSVSSVGSAILNWNFGSLYGGSGPAEIKLYVGNDADGVISISDRFMGTAIDTFTYSGGEVRNFDVTALLNASLLSGQYFAARLEATVAPDDLTGYYGGQFLIPSLEISPIPEPETYAMLLVGLGLLGFSAKRRK